MNKNEPEMFHFSLTRLKEVEHLRLSIKTPKLPHRNGRSETSKGGTTHFSLIEERHSTFMSRRKQKWNK